MKINDDLNFPPPVINTAFGRVPATHCKLLPLSFSSKLAFHWGCRAAIREGPVRELREGPIAGRVGSQPLLESPLATGPRHYAAVQSPDTGQPGP